jgi:hypothetical protein
LERVTDEKLTHMLSIHKNPTDKTGLGYVASSSDIPSTSKTVFIKPVVLEPPFTCIDKGKEVIGGDVPATAKAIQKPPTIRRPHICHHCGLSGHIRPSAPFSKLKDQRPRNRCQNKLHSALDPWPGIRFNHISSNSSDLFRPIKMANSRQTNQGTT